MHLADSLQMMSKLSLTRVKNVYQLFQSFQKSQKLGQALIQGMPSSIAVEPTTSCNLRCPECPSGLRSFTRATGMLTPELYEKILEEIAPTLTYSTLYFQGEPYLNPHFYDLIKLSTKYNLYSATSTNAHFLDEENARKTIESGLSRLIISIDGTSQDTYEQYRVGGKLDKVIEGTKNAVKAKKELGGKTHIIFQFLVVKPNQHQLEEVKQLAKELGVDEVKFKTAQIYDFKNGSDLIPTIDKYSRYRETADGTFEIKNELENKCWKMWQSCVITWDGRVVPCCFDKDAKYNMGSLKEQSFKDIWFGEKYNRFRQQLLDDRQSIDICQNCTEGLTVFAD